MQKSIATFATKKHIYRAHSIIYCEAEAKIRQHLVQENLGEWIPEGLHDILPDYREVRGAGRTAIYMFPSLYNKLYPTLYLEQLLCASNVMDCLGKRRL